MTAASEGTKVLVTPRFSKNVQKKKLPMLQLEVLIKETASKDLPGGTQAEPVFKNYMLKDVGTLVCQKIKSETK